MKERSHLQNSYQVSSVPESAENPGAEGPLWSLPPSSAKWAQGPSRPHCGEMRTQRVDVCTFPQGVGVGEIHSAENLPPTGVQREASKEVRCSRFGMELRGNLPVPSVGACGDIC